MADLLNNPLNTFMFQDLDNRNLGASSYRSVLGHIDRFRRSEGQTDDKRLWTGPVSYYFRPFFYFDSSVGSNLGARLLGLDYDSETFNSELLGNGQPLTFGEGQLMQGEKSKNNQTANSAINFLLQNCEWERAEKLLQFINLLSEISTYEPWQFQQVTGINEALTRKTFTGEAPDENRKSITFKCLQSGYNDRIGTLMDLYRDVCYSYYWKKEIVPANLRKFDMGIYIFSSPVRRFDIYRTDGMAVDSYRSIKIPNKSFAGDVYEDNKYYISAKYVEFLNCEFDYNSNVGAYSDLNNAEGKYLENEIKIFYDDCYEMRYNEFMMRVIGDMVFQDTDFECQNDAYQVDREPTSNPAKIIIPKTKEPAGEIKKVLDTPSTPPQLNDYTDTRIKKMIESSVNGALNTALSSAISFIPRGTGALGNLAQSSPISFLTGIAAGNITKLPSSNRGTDSPYSNESEDEFQREMKRGFVKKLP